MPCDLITVCISRLWLILMTHTVWAINAKYKPLSNRMAFWIVISKEFVLLLHLSACSGWNFRYFHGHNFFKSSKDPLYGELIRFKPVENATFIKLCKLTKIFSNWKKRKLDQTHLVTESGSNSEYWGDCTFSEKLFRIKNFSQMIQTKMD